MQDAIINTYQFLFARKIFYRFNLLLFRCTLRGIGVLNYQTRKLSGENGFLHSWLKGKPNCVVIDVGANVGNYSNEVLKINPSAVIYAFEPHPKNFEKLKANVGSPNFHPTNCAVGHEKGTLALYDYADNDGSTHASLYKDVIETIHNSMSVEHKVDIIALNSFLDANNIGSIELLKVDTEGNELNVLKGLADYLRAGKVKAIHFEFNEMNIFSRTYFKDFWDLLPNYALYRMMPDGLVQLKSYSPILCELFAFQNVVALLKH